MALAGRSRLILSLVYLWCAASLLNVGDAWNHWHPSYTEAEDVYDMQRNVIQPVFKKSAQLASDKDSNAHPRYRRNALPVHYRSLTSDLSGPSVAPHCSAWSQSHFRTFDGKTYNFHGVCQYTLVLDCTAYTFRISIQNDLDCFSPGTGAFCNRTVVIHNGDAAVPVYLRPGLVVGHELSTLDLPTFLDGLVIEKVSDSIMVTSGLGYKLIYDGDESVTVYITSDSLRGQTCGLCGVYNGDSTDDFKGPFGTLDNAYDFGLSWKEDDSCDDVPQPTILCTDIFIPPHLVHMYKDFIDLANFAKATCKKLEDDPSFSNCHSVIDVNPYVEACKRDMCNCQNGQDECACNSLTAYAMECARYGVKLDWRTNELCPWRCPADTVYHSCGTTCTQMCGSAASDCEEDHSIGCIEGCRCPADRFLNSDGVCVKEEDCPCISNGQEYDPGSTISDGCNQCTCNSGKWTCTNNICETLCWAAGDPHYKTFDDTRYNFMGECAYTLVKDCWDDDDKFEVIADNSPCGHQGLTCTQKVVVKHISDVIILAGNHRVSANGNSITHFPFVVDGITVDRPTTLLTVVSLGNGMVVRWDGNNRVEIVAPPSKFNSTCGLCGTFNKNQADDFMTPDGDRVASSTTFGNSWKVTFEGDNCPNVPPVDPPNVCELYSQKKEIAYEHCNKLFTEDVFKPCHRVVDPGPYFQDCRYDVCNGNDNDDHCPVFSQYASDCRQKDVILKDWRKAIPECDVECDIPGMSYSECAPSCGTSCQSLRALAHGAQCRDVCVEGCHCDHGKVVDHDGACIPPEECPCYEEFQWYDSGETIERDCQTCVCSGGMWQCDQVTCPTITCPENQFYSECLLPPECRPTCANFHDPPVCEGPCQRGCECDTGFVLDNGECIPISECQCYYRGEVYEPDEVRRVGCHVCTCKDGTVTCKNEYCQGTCIAWGDPHYQTFDAKKYDFQGECDYVLVTNSHFPNAKQFHILVGNVPCGSGGLTCTKAITMAIGTGAEQEKVMLVRGKPIEVDTGIGGLSEFTITESGLYILVHTNIGVTLMWDRATRIEVKVTQEHFNRVAGLCGNYNDIQEDDFLPPGGGIPIVDPNDFGNSWKVHDYCGKPPPIVDPCEANPHRKTWAQKKCSIITSPVFEPCHEYVPPADYFNNCVFDSCGCDSGGDCECMCTAIATYAQMCNQQGVPIKWRTQELCPIQCEGCLTYDPCIPVCESSCENQPFKLPDGLCMDTCVDGCACPPGTILYNDECVDECPAPTTVLPPTTVPPTTAPGTPPPPSPTPEPCECWGYGDPHYFDFNGVEFDDQGLCTYVLAKDKQEPPRFVVLIHNIECGLFPGTTCPREIEILYDGHRIRMLAERDDNRDYQVVIDGTTYTPPIETFDSFTVTEAGLYMLFDAPSIALQVRYLPVDLHYFKVEVPQLIYYNSTEGLCGNCGNPLPTCEETGTCCDWLAPPSKPIDCGCDVEPTECVPGPDIVDWCDKLYEDMFSECHHVVDPHDFHKNCLYNNCYGDKPTCWDFEAYVTECSAHGVCIDWREDDFCPYDCKNDQTHYRECACPDDIYTSCYPWDKEPHQCDMEPVSGCFCNEGSMDNGNGTCVPCPTLLPTTSARTTVVYTTEADKHTTVESTPPRPTTQPRQPTTAESTPPRPTTAESTPPPSTTVESTPPESTTVESTPPRPTTAESTPPRPTTVESTPPPSTTVESTPPESTTVESTPPRPTTVESTPPRPTTAESTPPASTTVESTPPESTTVESTPPQPTTAESTPPRPTTAESTPPRPTTAESTPPAFTTVESTPPESTTVESTPPQPTTAESTPPQPTTAESTPPPSTTVESTPPESTTVESTPPESTTVESTPPESTTVESTPPQPTTAESTPPRPTTAESTPPPSTTVESTPPESTTVESTPPRPTTAESTPPQPTTVESTPPASTTVESTPPESTTVESTPPQPTTAESTRPRPTTVESTPPQPTTVESTPPASTTVESTPPESTTVESTPPQPTTAESTPPRPTTVESTPPQPTTVESTPPASTTVESTPPESTTVESTPPQPTTVESTPPQPTTAESTPPPSTTVESTPPESTTVESTPPESTTVESTPPQPTTVESTSPQPTTAESTPPPSTTVESTPPESTTVESTPPASTTVQSTPPESTTPEVTTVESTKAPTTVISTVEFTTIESTTVESTTTVCVPGHQTVCKWSSYLDDENGQTNDEPYEFEFIADFLNDDRYQGVCAEPEAIKCVLARDHSVPHYMTTQDVQCSTDLGLACYDDEEQNCLDFAIRVQCCEEKYVICGSTESPPTTAGPPESTTIVESTTVAESTTVESTPPESTTVISTTVQPPTTACVPHYEELCKWTRYYDDSDSPHGDFEVLGDLIDAHPGELCENPRDIECVLASDHSVSAHQTGQNYTCLPNVGFLCLDFANNRRQPYECYDYAVRFQCCISYFVPCGTTEEAPTTEPEAPTTEPEPTTEPALTTEESTTECVDVIEKKCEWTPWLDDDEGKVGPLGEFELISTYREEYAICDTVHDIECVLKSRPSMHSNETGQVVTCNVDEGLVCLHTEQTEFPPFCFDYMIRVECCQDIVIPCNPQTTQPLPTTKPVPTTPESEYTTEQEPTTNEVPTTKPVPTTPESEYTTEQEPTTNEVPTTKLVPTTEQSTTAGQEPTTEGPEPTTKENPTTQESTYPGETTPQESTVPVESTTLASTVPVETTPEESTLPVESTTLPESTLPVETTSQPKKSTTEVESTTVVETKPPPTVSTTQPNDEATTESESTTPCKPLYEEVCEWTPWMDDDDGKVGPIGEFELISTFREQYDFCVEPRQIQCALASDHELLVNMTRQNVLCNPTEGLICLHNDQPDIPRCFDYSIRLRCCKFVNVGCGTTPEPAVTTVASTTKSVATTTAPPHNNEVCQPYMPDRPTTIIKDGCSTPNPVYMPMCQGRCESHTVFNGYEANGNEFWKSICRCCRPDAFETDYYEMVCPDGETVTLPVEIVTGCSCKEFECQ